MKNREQKLKIHFATFKLQAGRGAEEGAVREGPARARLLRPGGTVIGEGDTVANGGDTVAGTEECRTTV